MASKKEALKASMTQRSGQLHARKNPLLADAPKKPQLLRAYSFALSPSENAWIDELTETLRRTGAKATRSLVAREAFLRLQESLRDKSPADIAADFNEHQARRLMKK